jgi:hypothetical protein
MGAVGAHPWGCGLPLTLAAPHGALQSSRESRAQSRENAPRPIVGIEAAAAPFGCRD